MFRCRTKTTKGFSETEGAWRYRRSVRGRLRRKNTSYGKYWATPRSREEVPFYYQYVTYIFFLAITHKIGVVSPKGAGGKNAKTVAPSGGGGSTFVEAFFADELGKRLELLTEITIRSPWSQIPGCSHTCVAKQ